MSSDPDNTPGFAVILNLSDEQLETLVRRVADRLTERADDGLVNVDGAARFLGSCSRGSVYHLVARDRIRAHRVGGRLLFDPAELRADVERGE